jgi:hypothetical protein
MLRSRALAVAALLGAAAFCATVPAAPPAPASAATTELAGTQLLAALRGGGYILYFRHTSTDFGENDTRMTGYEDCSTQRNLTDVGRDEARAIGAALRRLRIPIGRVLASPFCRTMETGRLIFGHAESTPAVRGGPAQDTADRYAELRALLSMPVPPGTNLAIASHGNPYQAVVSGSYLREGEAAVIAPLGKDGFRVVARVPKDGWTALGP